MVLNGWPAPLYIKGRKLEKQDNTLGILKSLRMLCSYNKSSVQRKLKYNKESSKFVFSQVSNSWNLVLIIGPPGLLVVFVNFTLVHNNMMPVFVYFTCDLSSGLCVVRGPSLRMVLDIFTGNLVFKTSWVHHFWFCASLTKYNFSSVRDPGESSPNSRGLFTPDILPPGALMGCSPAAAALIG